MTVYDPTVEVHDFIPAYPGHRGEQHLLAVNTAPTCNAGLLDSPHLTAIPYVPGYSGHTSGPIGTVRRVVLHATVSACKPGGDREVAAYFASSRSGGLAHYVVDPAEIIQCASESLATWGAPPNAGEIHVEMCDPQSGSSSRWQDAAHVSMLALTAALVRDICTRHGLPLTAVDSAGLLAGHLGMCQHIDVSDAWHQTDHQDPQSGGPFDEGHFMSLVQGTAPPAAPGLGGAILAYYNALPATVKTAIGPVVTPELPCPDGVGRYNHFTNAASIYWTPQTGAHLISGAFRLVWSSLGWEKAAHLGYATNDEGVDPSNPTTGRRQDFQAGILTWAPDAGVWIHYRAG